MTKPYVHVILYETDYLENENSEIYSFHCPFYPSYKIGQEIFVQDQVFTKSRFLPENPKRLTGYIIHKITHGIKKNFIESGIEVACKIELEVVKNDNCGLVDAAIDLSH